MNQRDKQLLDAYERGFALQEEYLGTDKPVNRIDPLVSVRTATYQHAPYIRQCLDSILMQECDFPWEFIIGEDGSTDGTREICIEYAERHPDRIRLFLRDRSLSRYREGKREIGFNGKWTCRSARGRYHALCEGDDYWTDPKKLQKQVEVLKQHPDYAMSFHNVLIVSECDSTVPGTAFTGEMKREYFLEDICYHNMIQTCSVMYRRALLSSTPPIWCFRLPMGDWPLWIWLASKGRVAYLSEIMGAYRTHQGGVWSSQPKLAREEKKIHAASVIRRNLRPSRVHLNSTIARLRKRVITQLVSLESFRKASYHSKRLLADYLLQRIPLSRTEVWSLVLICIRCDALILWRLAPLGKQLRGKITRHVVARAKR